MPRLDVIIFGATGFTGKFLVREAAEQSKEDDAFTWGVAGRSGIKLAQVLGKTSVETGVDFTNLTAILADTSDYESLKSMTSQARVVINCTGPYLKIGEPVLKACIETATHYVDITAEIQFMQKTQLLYNKRASEARVYAVSACGLDCVPTDLGVVFLQQQFKGTLNSAESFMTLDIPSKYRKLGTALVNYGTFDSLVNSVARGRERESLRRQLYPEALPKCEPKQKKRSLLYKNFNNWFLPSDLADNDVVYTTQRYFYEANHQRPIQFRSYIGFPTRLEAYLLTAVLGFAYLMFKCGVTRRFILRHPKVFTLGYISREGVGDEVMNSMRFNCYLSGEGWDESIKDVTLMKPNKTILAKVSGVNPGYAFTAVAAFRAALTILKESDKMPGEGGVLTTGIAFANTSYIETLGRHGYKFQVIEEAAPALPIT